MNLFENFFNHLLNHNEEAIEELQLKLPHTTQIYKPIKCLHGSFTINSCSLVTFNRLTAALISKTAYA